jgi:predicted nucleotidyltransferase
MNTETFGELIRRLRVKKELTLREVAAGTDIDQSTLSKIERNEIVAPSRLIKPLAACLNYDYRKLQIKFLSEKLFKELKLEDYPVEALDIARKRLEREQKGTTFDLERKNLIQKIKAYLQEKPVEKAWLFGSFARNQMSQDSDLDILVRFVKPNKLNLFDYVGISQDLEDITGRKVDLVQEGFVVPMAQKNIDQEKMLIYERKTG